VYIYDTINLCILLAILFRSVYIESRSFELLNVNKKDIRIVDEKIMSYISDVQFADRKQPISEFFAVRQLLLYKIIFFMQIKLH